MQMRDMFMNVRLWRGHFAMVILDILTHRNVFLFILC